MTGDLHFEAIYNQYSKLVYNLSLHYVLNQQDAQDITQEVFIKVYQKGHQFDPSAAAFKTWISRITINHCLDFIKAKKTGKRLAFITSLFKNNTDQPYEVAANIDHPGIAAEHKEALERLLRIIYSLPPNQKTVIILSKIDGRPQKEVADIMSISVKAVESLLQRAKQAIQKELETEGF